MIIKSRLGIFSISDYICQFSYVTDGSENTSIYNDKAFIRELSRVGCSLYSFTKQGDIISTTSFIGIKERRYSHVSLIGCQHLSKVGTI